MGRPCLSILYWFGLTKSGSLSRSTSWTVGLRLLITGVGVRGRGKRLVWETGGWAPVPPPSTAAVRPSARSDWLMATLALPCSVKVLRSCETLRLRSSMAAVTVAAVKDVVVGVGCTRDLVLAAGASVTVSADVGGDPPSGSAAGVWPGELAAELELDVEEVEDAPDPVYACPEPELGAFFLVRVLGGCAWEADLDLAGISGKWWPTRGPFGGAGAGARTQGSGPQKSHEETAARAARRKVCTRKKHKCRIH